MEGRSACQSWDMLGERGRSGGEKQPEFSLQNKKRRRDELRPSASFARSVASVENLRFPSSLARLPARLRPSGAHRCCSCQERLSGCRLAADGEKRRTSQRGGRERERESTSTERERAKEVVRE